MVGGWVPLARGGGCKEVRWEVLAARRGHAQPRDNGTVTQQRAKEGEEGARGGGFRRASYTNWPGQTQWAGWSRRRRRAAPTAGMRHHACPRSRRAGWAWTWMHGCRPSPPRSHHAARLAWAYLGQDGELRTGSSWRAWMLQGCTYHCGVHAAVAPVSCVDDGAGVGEGGATEKLVSDGGAECTAGARKTSVCCPSHTHRLRRGYPLLTVVGGWRR